MVEGKKIGYMYRETRELNLGCFQSDQNFRSERISITLNKYYIRSLTVSSKKSLKERPSCEAISGEKQEVSAI